MPTLCKNSGCYDSSVRRQSYREARKHTINEVLISTLATFLSHGKAQEYLRKRGIYAGTAKRARLGYIPETLPAGLTSLLEQAGWQYAGIKNRIIFPAYYDRELVMVTSRSITDESPKHKHLYQVDAPYPYGLLSMSKPYGNDLVMLVESPICALTLQQFGYKALALYGIGTARNLVPFLTRYKNVLFICDNDESGAGVEGFKAVAEKLASTPPFPFVRLAVPIRNPGENKVDVNDIFIRVNKDVDAFKGELRRIVANATVVERKPVARPKKTIRSSDLSGIKSIPITDVCKLLGYEMERIGNRFRIKCPVHQDSNPSLVIYDRTNTFNCFGCNNGGDVIRFVQFTQNKTFQEAKEWLQSTFRIKP